MIPADFPECATRPVSELAAKYRVSRKTVSLWRKQLGVVVRPGAPRGNQNSTGNLGKKKPTHGIDGIEAVRICLSCTKARCRGHCERVN